MARTRRFHASAAALAAVLLAAACGGPAADTAAGPAEVALADDRFARMLPRRLSGGQAQHVAIAHDLGGVRTINDNVMVMYLGRACEFGDAERVYDSPRPIPAPAPSSTRSR